ncbi:MAG TPA: lantibiotic dehydratase [Ktedonobacteraceae bacterium]
MISQNPDQARNPWTLLPCFLLRSTGFPFEQLDELRMPLSQARSLRVLEFGTQLDRLHRSFNEQVFPGILDQEQERCADSPTFERWYQLNRCVYKRKVCPPELKSFLVGRCPAIGAWIEGWNTALEALAASQEEFEQAFASELRSTRERLHEIARDQLFQEALLLSTPNMYSVALPSYLHHYAAYQRPAKVRHLERRLYTYLQRFCAKNDTTSFFGPIDYGRYDPAASEPLALTRVPDGRLAQRLTRMTYWATQALADVIAGDQSVQPYLVPRLQSGCTLLPSGELSVVTHGQTVRLPRELAALLGAIDGQRSISDLWQALGGEQWPMLHSACARGLIVLRIEIPTAVFNPLEWLRARVAQLPGTCEARAAWLQRLDQFHQGITTFAAAPIEEKLALLERLESDFSGLAKKPARRSEGETYADRLLIYDEAHGDIADCTIGRALHDRLLASLRPALDLCASYSVVLQRVCMKRAREVFLAMGGGEPQPYLAFVYQLERQVRLEECVADTTVQDFLQGLAGLARERQQGEHIRLSASDLRPYMQPIQPGTMVSPDLFLAAHDVAAIRAGDYQLVVGEIHYGAQVWCHFLTFSPRQDELASALATCLVQPGGTPMRAALVHRRQQGKTFYLELPGMSIEMLGRSVKERDQVLPAMDLDVVLTDDGLALHSRSLNEIIDLYPGDPRSVSNWIFGTPPVIPPVISLGTYTPRCTIQDVVMQRAHWKLATDELTPPHAQMSGSELMLHASAFRQRHGLPERCFARVPSERKPFYVDFASLFSLELLFTMIRDNATLELTECLPEADQWWLKKVGGTHSCEWRMTMVYQ